MTKRLFPALAGRSMALAAMMAVALAGCSDKTVKKVSFKGNVTLKGQPVPAGILRFVGPGGSYSAASIQPDGTYIVTDVVPGEIKVGVMESPSGSGSSSGEKGAPAPKAVSIPAKFREPESSGLKYTVTPETKQLDIELK